MPVQIICPHPDCGHGCQIDDQTLGLAHTCPGCRQLFQIRFEAFAAGLAVANVAGEQSPADLAAGPPTLVPEGEPGSGYPVPRVGRPPANVYPNSGTNGHRKDPLARAAGTADAESPGSGDLTFAVAPVAAEKRIGRFALRACLGEGAFGEVFRAQDPQLEREVALKVAKPNTLATPHRIERFRREARAAAQLRHPHIVPLFETGQDGDQYYIASAYIPGQTLEAALKTGPLDFRRTAQIVRDLAEALAYAHQQGVVHRDLKPANIMLDDTGEPLLMDFGLAWRQDEPENLTHEGTIVGTPLYMAPEQATAHNKTEPLPASDQYGLGVVLYELLTGRTPFGGTPEVVLYKHIHHDPPRPSRYNDAIPRELETICLKTLAKNPCERYTNCQELADDLRRFLDGEEIRAGRDGILRRTVRWARRKPTQAALLGVTVVALVGVMAALAVYADNKSKQARLSDQDAQLAQKKLADKELEDETSKMVKVELLLAEKHESEGRGAEARDAYQEAEQPWKHAREAYRTAEAALKAQPGVQAPMTREEIQQKLEQIEQRLQARERLQEFHRHRERALVYGTLFTGPDEPRNRERVCKATRDALSLYGLTNKNDPAQREAFLQRDKGFRSKAEEEELASACSELLLLWAKAEGDQQTLEQETPRELARQPASFLLALKLYRNGQLETACKTCAKVLQQQPQHYWARHLQGLCQLKRQQWPQAWGSFTACLVLRPDFNYLYVLRGQASSEWGYHSKNPAEYASAQADFDQALKQVDDPLLRYVALVCRGTLAIRQTQWREAVSDLQQALVLDREQYQGYVNLAEAYRGLKDWPAAEVTLTEALTKWPDLAVGYDARARVRLERDARREARADFEKAIRLEEAAAAAHDSYQNGRLARLHLELGKLLQRDTLHEAALGHFQKAGKLWPNLAMSWLLQADALRALGRYAEAGQALDTYLKGAVHPDLKVYLDRASLHAQAGEFPAAIARYTLALDRDPEDTATRAHRGWTYLQMNDVALAQDDFEACLARNPDDVDARIGLAHARVRQKQWSAAVADAVKGSEAAERQGKNGQRVLYNLACFYGLVMAQVEAEGRNNPRVLPRLAVYEDQALLFLERTMEKVPPEQRAAFWRDNIQAHPDLASVRRGIRYGKLSARYTAGKL